MATQDASADAARGECSAAFGRLDFTLWISGDRTGHS